MRCVSQNADLASLTFVEGVLAPAFDPAVKQYGLVAPLFGFLTGVDGTAKPASESATIAIGPAFVAGARGAVVPLTVRDRSIAIRVLPAAGGAMDYRLDRTVRAALFKGSPPHEGGLRERRKCTAFHDGTLRHHRESRDRRASPCPDRHGRSGPI